MNSGRGQPVKRKGPKPGSGPEHEARNQELHDILDEGLANASLGPRQAKQFREAMSNAIRRLSAGAAEILARNVTFRFYPTTAEFMRIYKRYPNPKKKPPQAFTVDFFVHCRGGKFDRPLEDIWTHEIAHVLNNSFNPIITERKEWKVAWEDEIRDQFDKASQLLGKHAKNSEKEGFAELFMLVYNGVISLEEAELYYPECSEVMEKFKLW